jgi:hypothetical protein
MDDSVADRMARFDWAGIVCNVNQIRIRAI